MGVTPCGVLAWWGMHSARTMHRAPSCTVMHRHAPSCTMHVRGAWCAPATTCMQPCCMEAPLLSWGHGAPPCCPGGMPLRSLRQLLPPSQAASALSSPSKYRNVYPSTLPQNTFPKNISKQGHFQITFQRKATVQAAPGEKSPPPPKQCWPYTHTPAHTHTLA
jgi:hypothetical protein